MSLSWKPDFELLEAREVPATIKLLGYATQQVVYPPEDPTIFTPLPAPTPTSPPTGGTIVIVLPPPQPTLLP